LGKAWQRWKCSINKFLDCFSIYHQSIFLVSLCFLFSFFSLLFFLFFFFCQ
jgi:hypothetical protein